MIAEHPGIYTSLVDRLVDTDPQTSRESVHFKSITLKEVEASVIRDIESLLNTRRKILDPPAEYTEVRESVYTYGLRDFTAENPESVAVKRRLRQEIEQSISRFEPRLKNVHVRLEQTADQKRAFHFRISGTLVIESLNEPVAFDTYFDVQRREYIISS